MSLPPLVDETNLARYLAVQLPDGDGPVRAERVDAGHSNLTFVITRAPSAASVTRPGALPGVGGSAGSNLVGPAQVQQFVLRRPPRPPYLPTAHDVLREYRVISALARTDFPAPRPILACEDSSVIGSPFYLMQKVDGTVIRNALPESFSAVSERAAIAGELVRTLVALHGLDYQAIGLGNLGKPEGYVARQIKRWVGQLDGARTRPTPDLDFVSGWLQAHLPESPPATIVHGDYRLDNVIYAAQPPARILAVLDWEMSTLGDPLADLGYLLSFWREAGEPPATPLPDDMGDVTSLPGFPSRADVAARYEALSGRKVTHLTFYIALAIWKLAILLEGSYKRFQQGTTDDPFFALLKDGVPALAARARGVAKGEGALGAYE